MVDLHCHIIPGLDDGPSDETEFLEMANAAIESGITHIYATPHHLNGRFINTKFEILESVFKANDLLQLNNISLFVHPGQELRIHGGLLRSIESEEVLTLDNNESYLLIELPASEVPPYTHNIVYELLLKGITPIIVHPERNNIIRENPEIIYELVREGAMTQLTAGSILGFFSKKVQSFAEQMIKHHLVHFIATDAHDIKFRGFSLQYAYDHISVKYGKKSAAYFKDNAYKLMQGESLKLEDPLPIRKRFIGVF
ncbi:tyrosine-protein phosphatase [Bacillus sp. UMB0728]|uniref:tyrosine-protein phosphatase n=1 Tax=Bacillus sp. UMB0728 TaxID=2066052 RepID=UPI000C75C1EA|nr:CpsB/CapC family capsule biosynthesis tyrosine phosphatase [Bacillus sp. UMB0728]PLR73524.1 tyrosine protein phosphatase [Bacillus sp. UMB0728]